jgi:hypothetical protein
MQYQIANNMNNLFEYSTLLIIIFVIIMCCSLRMMFYYTTENFARNSTFDCSTCHPPGDICMNETDNHGSPIGVLHKSPDACKQCTSCTDSL